MDPIGHLLARFDPITLEEMDRVKLQDRTDTKFVFGSRDLEHVLEQLLRDYRLLVINGRRGADYRTLYYDTADLRHFHDHHNGRTFRSKVRYREYVGSDLCFLEVKRKTGRGGTSKARLRVEGIPEAMPARHLDFVRKANGMDQPLLPQLWNAFTRYTLVHRTLPERLTIDRDLTFARQGKDAVLDGICIAELKEEKGGRTSPFLAVMRAMGHRPTGMSKYCAGLWLLEPRLKTNTFKGLFLKLDRLRAAA